MFRSRTPETKINHGLTENGRFVTVQPPLEQDEIRQLIASALIRSGDVIPGMSEEGPMSAIKVPSAGEDAKKFMHDVAWAVRAIREVEPVVDREAVYMGAESTYSIPFIENTVVSLN